MISPSDQGPDQPQRQPLEVIQSLISDTVGQAARAIPPAVGTAVTTFGFPLGLVLAILAFLLIQNRLDRRDPKLRTAALTEADTLLPFEGEDEL